MVSEQADLSGVIADKDPGEASDPVPKSSGLRRPTVWVPAALVAAFIAISLVILWSWSTVGMTVVEGDEQHYLVLSKAIRSGQLFDLPSAYLEEFRLHEFGVHWPLPSEPLVLALGHLGQGAGGVFSGHGLGLPALLALPTWLGGLLGGRLAMILFSATLVALAWWISKTLTESTRVRAATVVACTFAMPFLTGANQVYPDLPAGALFVAGVAGILGDPGLRRWLPFIAAAILPWLQIKLVVLAFILVVLGLIRLWQDGRRLPRIVFPLLPAFVSILLLATYNLSVIGSLSPGSDGYQEANRAALTRLIGLVTDQNQGILFNNPLLVLGVAGLIPLWRRDRLATIAVVLSVMGVLTMNAMHVNWYGGYSLSGRFEWTASAIMVIPALALLTKLAEMSRKVFYSVVVVGCMYQVLLFASYIRPDFHWALYNRTEFNVPLPAYGALFPGIPNLLPAWYDATWAFNSSRNWAWLLAVSGVVALACVIVVTKRYRRAVTAVAGIFAIGIAAGIVVTAPAATSQRADYGVESLAATTGKVVGASRIASAPANRSGSLATGPTALPYLKGLPLQSGRYVAKFEGRTIAEGGREVGRVVVSGSRGSGLAVSPTTIAGSGPLPETQFEVSRNQIVDIRLLWNGVGSIQVSKLTLVRQGS